MPGNGISTGMESRSTEHEGADLSKRHPEAQT